MCANEYVYLGQWCAQMNHILSNVRKCAAMDFSTTGRDTPLILEPKIVICVSFRFGLMSNFPVNIFFFCRYGATDNLRGNIANFGQKHNIDRVSRTGVLCSTI